MSVPEDRTTPAPDDVPAGDAAPATASGDGEDVDGGERSPQRGRRRRLVYHLGKRGSALLVAAIAAALVSVLSIDLGPSLRELAEREGGKRLQRPLHIGQLSVRLLRGEFVLDRLRVEGLTPADAPFFTAERITIGMPWWWA